MQESVSGGAQRLRAGAGEQTFIKAIVLRERINIEEVPHATVDLTQDDHGVQLLSNCGFRTTRAQASLRKVKQPQAVQPLWLLFIAAATSALAPTPVSRPIV